MEGGSRKCRKWSVVVCGRAGATKFEQPRTSSLLILDRSCSLFLFLAPAAAPACTFAGRQLCRQSPNRQ